MPDQGCAPERTPERTLNPPILTKGTRQAWCSSRGLAVIAGTRAIHSNLARSDSPRQHLDHPHMLLPQSPFPLTH